MVGSPSSPKPAGVCPLHSALCTLQCYLRGDFHPGRLSSQALDAAARIVVFCATEVGISGRRVDQMTQAAAWSVRTFPIRDVTGRCKVDSW